MDAKSVGNMQSIIAVTNKHTAKLHHVGSLYILCLILLADSRIYRLRGFDPDGDLLRFGVRDQVGNEILRIENIGKNEADIFLKKELDREVM